MPFERLAIVLLSGCTTSSGPADGGGFCPQPGAFFCADYATTNNPAAGFSGVTTGGAAHGAVESGTFVASVPSDSKTDSAYAPFVVTMDPLGEVELAFRFRADTLPAILDIASVVYGEDKYQVSFEIAMDTLYIVEVHAGIVDSPWNVGRMPLGEWHDYSLVVSPTRRKLEARIDGGAVQSFAMASSQSFTLGGKKMLSIGIAYASATLPETKVAFDDIAFFAR